MKKVLLIICALIISTFISMDATANQLVTNSEVKIVQTFSQDSNLYAYVNFPEEKEINTLIAKVVIDGNNSYKQVEPIEKVADASEPISYMFLIDISTSMPDYEDSIKMFISNFMTSAGDDSSFAIATFGKSLDIICDFTDKQEEITSKLSKVEYNVRQTSLYTSLINTIDYYEDKERTQGEIFNIVVITDGIEYDKNGVTIDEVYAKLKASSVMVHTFGLPTKSSDQDDIEESEEALKVLGSFSRNSYGVHTVLGYANSTEAELAESITGYIHNLYITKYKISEDEISGGGHNVKIVFASTGENGDVFSAEGTLYIPYPEVTMLEDELPIPQITSSPDQTEEPEVSATPSEFPSDVGEISAKEETDTDVGVVASEANGSSIYLTIIIATSILVIFLVMIIIAMKLRKKKRRVSPINGIFMKVEILSDSCTLKNNEFYLTEELIIGRETGCNIRLKNKDVSKRNSKLYVRDNVVYIEDLNSTNGTAINSMKIFSPNKLRSGDVISIGSVAFILKF